MASGVFVSKPDVVGVVILQVAVSRAAGVQFAEWTARELTLDWD